MIQLMQFQYLLIKLKGTKMSKFYKIIPIIFITIFTNYVQASPIDNLERERARFLQIVLNKNISIVDRNKSLQNSKLKLLDLERITINNKNITKNPNYQTIRAFENFELTFLVHSSVEKDKSLSILWLEKLGLTTNSLMETRVSRR